MALSVNTAASGCTGEISDFSTSLRLLRHAIIAALTAIFTNNSCHLTSAVIPGGELVAWTRVRLLTHDAHAI